MKNINKTEQYLQNSGAMQDRQQHLHHDLQYKKHQCRSSGFSPFKNRTSQKYWRTEWWARLKILTDLFKAHLHDEKGQKQNFKNTQNTSVHKQTMFRQTNLFVGGSYESRFVQCDMKEPIVVLQCWTNYIYATI